MRHDKEEDDWRIFYTASVAEILDTSVLYTDKLRVSASGRQMLLQNITALKGQYHEIFHLEFFS
jgi:hypothetical protein